MEAINNILSSIIVVATPLIFVKILLNCKVRKNKIRVIVVSLMAIILNILVYKYTNGIFKSIISFAIYVLTLYQFYKISLNKATFSLILYLILLIVLELFIFLFLSSFVFSKEYLYEIFAGSLLANFIVYASVLPITLLLKKPLQKLLNMKLDFNKKVIIVSILTLISILTFFFEIIANFRVGVKIILYVIAIITFVIILIFLMLEENKNVKLKTEHEKLLEFMQTYEIELEKERVLRHEYKNELVTIKSKIIDGDKNNNVIDYIDELLDNESTFSQEGYTKFQYLPPNGLKALFYFKVSAAKNKGINTSINIDPDIKDSILSKLTTKEFKDLGLLIGVYMDNAIDASEISEKKILGIEMYDNKDSVTIIISNSYAGKIDINRIGKVHFSTKGKGRGYGLLLVNKTLKFNNKFETEREISPTLYVQSIIVKR